MFPSEEDFAYGSSCTKCGSNYIDCECKPEKKQTNKKFVPIELAKKLRDKGFNEPVLACYDGSDMLSTYSGVFEPKNYNTGGSSKISAPLWQEVIDWLDSKDVYVTIGIWHREQKGVMYFGYTIGCFKMNLAHSGDECCEPTRYGALKMAIEEALEYVED